MKTKPPLPAEYAAWLELSLPTDPPALRPRKSARERAARLVDLLLSAPQNRGLLEAFAEDALNREAGRAYDVLCRQMEQTSARDAKCPLCSKRKAVVGAPVTSDKLVSYEGFPDGATDFVEHAAKARSQYDTPCRALAGEVVRLRAMPRSDRTAVELLPPAVENEKKSVKGRHSDDYSDCRRCGHSVVYHSPPATPTSTPSCCMKCMSCDEFR